MTKLSKSFAISSLFFSLHVAHASSNHPTTFLGPTLRGGLTNVYTENAAYSIGAEAGLKNYRLNGTLAWQFWQTHKIKISAEYLKQDMTYAFFSGETKQWINQAGLGGTYQYDILGYVFQPSFALNAYYSHSPNNTLSPRASTRFNDLGLAQNFVNYRRISGSQDGSASPGFTITPWEGGRFGVDLNYDNINYDKKAPSAEDARGFGGTVHLKQALAQNIELGLLAAFRQPFNNYETNLTWNNVQWLGAWALGLDAVYTTGKNTLPNSYNIGLSAEYLLDSRCETLDAKAESATKFINYKGEVQGHTVNDGFGAWVAKPAVYLPQVLAVPDEYLSVQNAS